MEWNSTTAVMCDRRMSDRLKVPTSSNVRYRMLAGDREGRSKWQLWKRRCFDGPPEAREWTRNEDIRKRFGVAPIREKSPEMVRARPVG
ncbi:unnamed protein product [Caenorhabditis auriculariae]|uniref:Uncharacterized protein n=1 Tax=Caenorhabditis auriculariae TaxID=2777116 RepID=A0A8S1HBQ3_9PELO|nr:unnamed protein product [Caenorhabditis auriculariae]